MTFETDGEVCPVRADDGARAGSAQDPIIVKARRLQTLIGRRRALFPEPAMADASMMVMLTLFLAECEDQPLTGAALAHKVGLAVTQAGEVVAALDRAGLVRVGGLHEGSALPGQAQAGAGLEATKLGLTPMGSARMRSYLGDYPAI